MKERSNKKIFLRFFSSRLFLVVVGGLLLAFAFGFARSYYEAYKIQQEINSLKEQVQDLQQKKLESLNMLSYVLSQNFVEEKAREELNLKKDGEHVIAVPIGNENVNLEVKNVEETSPGQPVSNPLKWWYYFSHTKN
jgi:cell division protein FtsB